MLSLITTEAMISTNGVAGPSPSAGESASASGHPKLNFSTNNRKTSDSSANTPCVRVLGGSIGAAVVVMLLL